MLAEFRRIGWIRRIDRDDVCFTTEGYSKETNLGTRGVSINTSGDMNEECEL